MTVSIVYVWTDGLNAFKNLCVYERKRIHVDGVLFARVFSALSDGDMYLLRVMIGLLDCLICVSYDLPD